MERMQDSTSKGGQIQNKIDLIEILWARVTEQPQQTLVFTKNSGHNTSPGSMLHCHNRKGESYGEKNILYSALLLVQFAIFKERAWNQVC